MTVKQLEERITNLTLASNAINIQNDSDGKLIETALNYDISKVKVFSEHSIANEHRNVVGNTTKGRPVLEENDVSHPGNIPESTSKTVKKENIIKERIYIVNQSNTFAKDET